jgi:hypothetical protein
VITISRLFAPDLIVPKNLLRKPLILVQEGMTDPENIFFSHRAQIASGRSAALDWQYCNNRSVRRLRQVSLASEGYRDLFIRKGVKPEKIAVTGIPNFDNCQEYLKTIFRTRATSWLLRRTLGKT